MCDDLECAVWLVLLVLGRPEQLDLDVQLPVGLEVDPDLMKRLLCLADQVGEGEFAVGDEVVGGNGGAAQRSELEKFDRFGASPVENSEPYLLSGA